jgi:hypothetical protein
METLPSRTVKLSDRCVHDRRANVCRFCNPTAAIVTETTKTESKSNKPDPAFLWADGSTYDSGKDAWRLGRQQAAVWTILANAGWVPLHVVTRRVTDLLGQQCSDAAISARIRDLRKLRNGLHIVDCQRVEDSGTFEYRLVESGTEEWVRRWDELTPQVEARTHNITGPDETEWPHGKPVVQEFLDQMAAKDDEIAELQAKISRARFLVECHGDCNCHNTPVGVCGTCEALEALLPEGDFGQRQLRL